METPIPPGCSFVVQSELRVEPVHADGLIESFRARLGRVDCWPGFQRLEVWQDDRDPGVFAMVSWWSSRQSFVDYMRSQDHRNSHARIPAGSAAPHPVRLSRFTLVAT